MIVIYLNDSDVFADIVNDTMSLLFLQSELVGGFSDASCN